MTVSLLLFCIRVKIQKYPVFMRIDSIRTAHTQKPTHIWIVKELPKQSVTFKFACTQTHTHKLTINIHKNLHPNPSNEFHSSSIVQQIIADRNQIVWRTRVIGHTSVPQFKSDLTVFFIPVLFAVYGYISICVCACLLKKSATI